MQIRLAEGEDAGALAGLVVQLGYSGTAGDVARRLSLLAASEHDDVFVALDENRIAGFVHVCVVRTLENDEYAEIRGLIVDAASRGRGIGRTLVAKAEEWARERRVGRMRVRSNVTRERARAFYEREGYAVTKLSNVFDKTL